MEIYLGGSYQGKLNAAKQLNQEIFYCFNETLEYKPIISGLHLWVAYCFRNHLPINFDFEQAKHSLILMDEWNQGIVPIDETERALRECLGKFTQTCCKKASKVTYYIASIPLVIKDE